MGRRSRFMVLIAISAVLGLGCQAEVPSPSGSAPRASTAAGALPLLADVPFFRADPAANGIHPGPGPTGKPELAWRTSVGDMHMVPILVDGLLIVGTNEGRLVALDAHTGEQRWAHQANDAIKPSLAATAGLVYASDGSALHAVDVATGAKRWSAPVDDVVGRVNVVDGVAYVGTIGGVVGFDAQTGTEVWRWDGGPSDVPVGAGPIADGVGYFATRDARVFAVDTRTADVRWATNSLISNDVPSGQVLGDTFYVSTNQGEAAEPAGEIYAIDRESGRVRWRFRAPSGLQLKEGPVKDGVLYANGRQDGIWALRDDGDRASVLWHVDTPESHWPMALAGDTLYEVRVDGSLGAYDITEEGRLLWETKPDGNWAGGPIVSGGMVFIASDTTGVMAFADPELIAQLPKPTAEPPPTAAASGDTPSLRPNPFTVVRTISWTDTELDVPLGMDAGPDRLLYILDTKPELTVIDPDHGGIVRTWGRQGAGPGEFDVSRFDNNPGNGDVAVAPDGRVYVADGSNHRVQVFSPEGQFEAQFGSFGTKPGQFGAIEEIVVAPDGSVYVRDGYVSKFTADGKFVWRSTENLRHFAVRRDGDLISVCEQCRQLLHVSQKDGRIVERWDTPDMDGDGFGPVNLDPNGNIYVETYTAESLLIFDPHGRFIAGSYLQPGMRRMNVGKKIEWGDWYGPTPVFLPDGRAFTFAERGLVELKVTLPT